MLPPPKSDAELALASEMELVERWLFISSDWLGDKPSEREYEVEEVSVELREGRDGKDASEDRACCEGREGIEPAGGIVIAPDA